MATTVNALVIVSADAEWRALREVHGAEPDGSTPFGEYIEVPIAVGGSELSLVYVQGGWGKISAAASAQHAIDRWRPRIVVNLGTCGGIVGQAEVGDTILAERTVVYDIVEQMIDPQDALLHYATDLDLSWLAEPFPHPVRRTCLLSADRDGLPEQIPELEAKYSAVALDWESGAIAWVASRNDTRCLILRTVTDVISQDGDEAYDGTGEHFAQQATEAMGGLIDSLPAWLRCAKPGVLSD